VRLTKPWQLRKSANFKCTAMRNAPTWDDYNLPADFRRDELRLKLFRVNYRRADQRLTKRRLREMMKAK
jgi:hypothetical protein